MRQFPSVVMLGATVLSLALAGPARADARAGLDHFQAGQFSEAVQDWRSAAQTGDAASALYLGVVYDTGFGVAQDEREALAWYERAGSGGNATAMFNAGVMHDAGRGASPDPEAAITWYDRAAQHGFGRAEYNLGLIYENGRDRARAVRFYREAVGHGIAAARARLGALGVPFAAAPSRPREDPAMASFQRAQSILLARGADGAQRAAELFRKAAESGNPLAAYNLGYCYQHGLGVAPNPEEAIAWYQRSAATAGDPALKELAGAGARTILGKISHAQR